MTESFVLLLVEFNGFNGNPFVSTTVYESGSVPIYVLRMASARRCIMSRYTVSEVAVYVNRSYRHADSSLGAVSLLFWSSENNICYTDNIFDNTLRQTYSVIENAF